jgi:hypothetical protein
MATNKILITQGTPIVFRESGGDVVWTPKAVAQVNGRISAVCDLTASHSRLYRWRLQTRWEATATAGEMMRIYLITSNASATAGLTDGGYAFGDATITAEQVLLNNAKFLGAVISNGVDQLECASGDVEIYERYVAVVVWNASAAKDFLNDAGSHVFSLTPWVDDLQASA